MKKYLYIVLLVGVGVSQNDNSLGSKNFDADKYLEDIYEDYTSTAKYKLVDYCDILSLSMTEKLSETNSDLKVLDGTRFYESVSHLFTQHLKMLSIVNDIADIVRIAADTKEINTYKKLKGLIAKKEKDFYLQRDFLKNYLDLCKHEISIDRYNDIYKATKKLSIHLALLLLGMKKKWVLTKI